MNKPIYIGGPTASGKTAIAIKLAKALPNPGEIVCGDAFQLYQHFRTLTARPSKKEEAQCPHHLFGTQPLTENLNAETYRQLALPIIENIQEQNKTPIIVGGSGLYLKSLTHGLPPTPEADPILRKKLDIYTLNELFQQLQKLDPEGAQVINAKNRRYVSRAVEISLVTGEPSSKLKEAWENQPTPDIHAFWLEWDREELLFRIDLRTKQMLETEAIEEVQSALQISETAKKAIGYREIADHLQGELTLDECLEKIVIATRQYAKRQRSWFRRENVFTPVTVGKKDTPKAITEQIIAEMTKA